MSVELRRLRDGAHSVLTSGTLTAAAAVRCVCRAADRPYTHALTLARIAAGCTLTRRRSCSSACCASSGSLRVPRTL